MHSAQAETLTMVLSPGDHCGLAEGPEAVLKLCVTLCPTDTALCLQVAAVCKVLGAVEQLAAVGCQSRCSQGGDGGGSEQSGDLQGTAGQGLGWSQPGL